MLSRSRGVHPSRPGHHAFAPAERHSVRFESEFYSYLVLSEFGPFVRIPEPLAAWRGHPEGASAAHPLEIAEEVVLIFRRYFERDPLPPDIVPLRLALARARLTAAQIVMAKNPLLSARYCLATAHRLAPVDRVHTVGHIAATALYRVSGLAARRERRSKRVARIDEGGARAANSHA